MIRHIPVLAQEIYNNLPNNREKGFDWTFWHWWHAEFFLSHEQEKRDISPIKIIWTDIDPIMIEKAKALTEYYGKNRESKINQNERNFGPNSIRYSTNL